MPRRVVPPWGSTPPVARTTRELAATGMTRRALARAVHEGAILRVRRGLHVPADTHPDLRRAAEAGGRLDCISLLRHLGVFVLHADALHVQIEPHKSRIPSPRRDEVRHWRPTRRRRGVLTTGVVDALVQATRCQDPRSAVATLDSARHLGVIDDMDLDEVFSSLPRRYRHLRRLLDPRSESGPETLLRLVLRALGCRFGIQVEIRGVGRVDFLVDGWLIIECDSEAHHADWTTQKRDRRRDLKAARLGYTTVRLLAEDVMWHRDEVRAALLDVLAHGRPAPRAGI